MTANEEAGVLAIGYGFAGGGSLLAGVATKLGAPPETAIVLGIVFVGVGVYIFRRFALADMEG